MIVLRQSNQLTTRTAMFPPITETGSDQMYFKELQPKSSSIHRVIATVVIVLISYSHTCFATVVRFNSNIGSFDVRMYDTATPLSVANMMNYVNGGDFDNSIVHRAENTYFQLSDGSFVTSPFVIQSGDSAFDENGVLDFIPSDPAVQNEPGISNLRGTMALARISNQVNSGTNNWFINTGDNQFLDTVDQGFTVFGRVVNNGMEVVDIISNMPTATVRNLFNQTIGTKVPIHGDASNGIARENFVEFTSVEELNVPDGDANFDGVVSLIDFLHVQRGYESISEMSADFNGDAVVDDVDFTTWENAYNAALQPLVTSVPEPSSVLLLTLGVLMLNARRR